MKLLSKQYYNNKAKICFGSKIALQNNVITLTAKA